jgi:TldD protein
MHVCERRFAAPALVFMLLFVGSALCKTPTPSPILTALEQELTRSFNVLKRQPTPPYFIAYEATEKNTVNISTSFGALYESKSYSSRQLDIDMRVGDYALDNTRGMPGDRYGSTYRTGIFLPIDENGDAVKAIAWYNTDKLYKDAVERLIKIKTSSRVRVEREDTSADFSREKPDTLAEPIRTTKVDRALWEAKLRSFSAPFARCPALYGGDASLTVEGQTRWFVNTEGARIQTSDAACRLMITAYTKADDGMEMPLYESFFAPSPDSFPSDDTILARVNTMVRNFQALRGAPVVEPYSGPALVMGRASGVFFHEILGHRLEGHRQKEENEGQTFKKKINEKILPEFLSVTSDPTIRYFRKTPLAGSYTCDNQGVKSRRVSLIENGILRRFLMSRSPIDGFSQSNGHGRRQPGLAPVSRQSNLVVTAAHPVSTDSLKRMIIALCLQEKKPYGLIFSDISGGYTLTSRSVPNAFTVVPLLVYKLYPDGRQELVRGVDIIGTPLASLARIVAADSSYEVFNGTCGAESGNIPVSAVAPGIVISQLEVQKKDKSRDKAPILPPPSEVEVQR